MPTAIVRKTYDRAGSSGPLRSVPFSDQAAVLALGVRKALGIARADVAPVGRIEEICRTAGIKLRLRRLRGKDDGLQAVLAACPGGFEVTVDTEPPGGWKSVPETIRPGLHRHRLRFRVAHELAHTLFYDRTTPRPHRIVPDSTEQEAFCDVFARAFLVPPAGIPPRIADPAVVVSLARRYDVSLEVAVRAVAAAHPDMWFGLYLDQADGATPQWLSSAAAGPPWMQWWVRRLDPASDCAKAHHPRDGWIGTALPLPARRQLLVIARAK